MIIPPAVVEELGIHPKYNSISAVDSELRQVSNVREKFVGFQHHLYAPPPMGG